MTSPDVPAVPAGLHTITPHIVVADAAAAAEWHAKAFGAEERSRVTLPGGKVMTLELRLGDSAVMVASEFPEMGIVGPLTVGGTSSVLQIYSEGADELWERAIGAGAEIAHPIGDTFWGDRHGQIVDPFGHRWNIAQHLRDVSPEDVEAAAAQAFGG